MQKVCLIRASEYDTEAIRNGLLAAWELLSLSELFSENDKVILKPNLLSAVKMDAAVTTHPAVFEAVAEIFLDESISGRLSLSYGDSPAHESPARAARICGLADVAARLDLPFADFDNSREVEFTDSKFINRLPIAVSVLECDALVSLSKFKTHALTGITGAVKNQYGVVTGLQKARYHGTYAELDAFARMLGDLNKWLKPKLFIMDAITVMEGNGPRNGKPRQAGLVLVGTDPVAIDSTMASITGHDPLNMTIFKEWQKMGLGVADPDKIEVCVIKAVSPTSGSEPEGKNAVWQNLTTILPELRIADFEKARIESSLLTKASRLGGGFMRRYILNRPRINPELCIACGHCVNSCPVEPKALQQQGRQVPYYKYERCIRCYCCQEICPEAAISVYKAWSK